MIDVGIFKEYLCCKNVFLDVWVYSVVELYLYGLGMICKG